MTHLSSLLNFKKLEASIIGYRHIWSLPDSVANVKDGDGVLLLPNAPELISVVGVCMLV